MLRVLRTYGFGWLAISCLLLAFSSCNTTKFVPQDKYLLNKARVKCVDDKTVATNELRNYLRQKQNTEIFGFWKLQLHVYDTAPTDTTTKSKKKLAENAHKMGEAPMVYDDELTAISMQQLQQQMYNQGYFQATVDTQKVIKDRKVNLTYLVTAHQPYIVRNYDVDLPIEAVRRIAEGRGCIIKQGQQFSTAQLDEERARITNVLHNMGYFYAEKSMLEFTADSALGTHEVDIRLHLAPYVEHLDSASAKRLQTRYTVRNVAYHIDYDPRRLPDTVAVHCDSDKYGNRYSWTGNRFLTKRALRHASRIRGGERYSAWRVERTAANILRSRPMLSEYTENTTPKEHSRNECFGCCLKTLIMLLSM